MYRYVNAIVPDKNPLILFMAIICKYRRPTIMAEMCIFNIARPTLLDRR